MKLHANHIIVFGFGISKKINEITKKIWKTYNIYDDIVCFFELILIGRFFIGLIISGNVRGILMILIFLT